MRARSIKKAMQRHGLTTGPVSCRDLLRQFRPVPSDSLKALLITMGPFEPATDAYRFANEFNVTDEQVEQIRQHYRLVIDFVLGASPLQLVRDVLDGLSVDIPVIGRVGLPAVVVNAVIGSVQSELAGLLTDLIINMTAPLVLVVAGEWSFPPMTFTCLIGPLTSAWEQRPHRPGY